MKAILQRVSSCSVSIDNKLYSEIDKGILVLLGIGKDDNDQNIQKMINKILVQRIFPDDEGKLNFSLTDIMGEIMIVSNFTIYGDTKKGTRPSYTQAAKPTEAKMIYDKFLKELNSNTNLKVASGEFQAMMKVELVNDGPVTIILET